MAEYIDDTGSSGLDALLSGTKGGAGTTDYDYSTTNKVLTLNTTATGTTDFTLPSSTAWILVETYDVEGVTGAVGYTKWQSDVSAIDTDIQAMWDIVDTNVNITNFKMVATYYKTGNLADVYETDQTGTFSTTPTATDVSYTPSAWAISQARTAPDTGAVYGSEMITTADNTFTTTTGWTETGAVISGGVATFSATADDVQTTAGEGLVDDTTYRVWYDVSTVTTAGITAITLGGYNNVSVKITTTGLQYVDIRVDDNRQNGKVKFYANTFRGAITSISVKPLVSGEQLGTEILNDGGFDNGTTNWTLSDAGFTISASALNMDTAISTSATNDQTVTGGGLAIGDIVRCDYTCSAYTDGKFYLMLSDEYASYGRLDQFDTPVGSHTLYSKVTATTNNTIQLVANTSPTLSLTSVSLKKVLT